MRGLVLSIREGIFFGRKCLSLLAEKDKRKFKFYLVLQLLLTGLDVLGILLIAAIASIASWAIQGSQPSGYVLIFLEFFHLQDQTPQKVALIMGVIATLSLICKSILSFYLTKRSLRFLSGRDAELSSSLTQKILNQDLDSLRLISSFEYQNSITIGSNAVTAGLLSQSALLVTELIMQLVLFITLFAFAPIISLSLFIYFALFLVFLTFKLGRTAKTVSQNLNDLNIITSRTLFEAIQNFRVIKTSSKTEFFALKIRQYREEVADLNVEQSMLSVWSKFAYEVALLIAGVIFAAFAFLSYPASRASALLAIFLAAAYRIAPSIMKVQGAVVQIKGSIGSAKVFFRVLDHVNIYGALNVGNISSNLESYKPEGDFNQVQFESVDFSFKDSSVLNLRDISLAFSKGERVALVGPSGAGKSTFIDLLIGLLKPTNGRVALNGLLPSHAIQSGQITIGYVPQEVILISGTIRENLVFGFDTKSFSDNEYWKVLSDVGLHNWVHNLSLKLDAPLGEFNSRLSGGQRQRLGIARALLRRPDLLILDESTSALDSESEKMIVDLIMSLDRSVTLIVIAHRLSTVRQMDVLYYFDEGQIVASGTFDELRKNVPNFDLQAKLLNLSSIENDS